MELQQEVYVLHDSLSASTTDPVTHLLGWQLFVEHVNQQLHESMRFQFTFAILSIDIADFQTFNNALGQEVGREILLEVAKRFQASIRQIDSLSRASNNRFFIALPKLSKPETAAIVVQRLLQSLAQPMQIGKQDLYVNMHVGIAFFPADGDDSATLFSKAESALQAAKQNGGQGYQFYQEAVNTNSHHELAVATGLKRDSILEELEIEYIPIVDVKQQTVTCMQAVLRWRHPELGLIETVALFQQADKQGKSNHVVEWLLREACQKHLQDIKSDTILLSVPISIHQLKNSHFIYRLSQILQECHFKPECLMLEIMDDNSQFSFEMVEKAINMLNYLHVKLAVRRFGVNNLSIQQIKQIGAHYLKLDPSLITDISNEQTKAMVCALTALASSLGMRLVVSGADSKEQMAVFSQLGCELMQGAYISGEVKNNQSYAITHSV